MNRVQFLKAAGLLFGAAPLSTSFHDRPASYRQPRFLRSGDSIGITAPAGAITLAEIEPALQVLRSWGYAIKIGSTIGKQDCSFGGTDDERTKDLQAMLNDPHIKAIWCARGGYGLVRIIDNLTWKEFLSHPKWIIGFSDATILHCQLQRLAVASIHGKMLNSFPDVWADALPLQRDTIWAAKRMLEGERMNYSAAPHAQNKPGNAQGTLVGGNLKILETLSGTASDVDMAGKILFVEDTGEYLYSIDRMFWHLQRTGKLKRLAGLIVGGFSLLPEDGDKAFGRTVQDIVLEKVGRYSYPVCFDFAVGHQLANWPLKCGAVHRLVVKEDAVSLTEV